MDWSLDGPQEPVWKLLRKQKFLAPARNRALAVKPGVRHYIDLAVPAPTALVKPRQQLLLLSYGQCGNKRVLADQLLGSGSVRDYDESTDRAHANGQLHWVTTRDRTGETTGNFILRTISALFMDTVENL
jgi:hypothetical protein